MEDELQCVLSYRLCTEW